MENSTKADLYALFDLENFSCNKKLSDANSQLKRWVMETAGNRIHGTTKQKPLTLFAESEKHLLRPLPDVPVQIATWTRLKLHGDCHVRFEKAFYSAPFRLVHQDLYLKATDNSVKIYRNLEMVATPPPLAKTRRPLHRGGTFTPRGDRL